MVRCALPVLELHEYLGGADHSPCATRCCSCSARRAALLEAGPRRLRPPAARRARRLPRRADARAAAPLPRAPRPPRQPRQGGLEAGAPAQGRAVSERDGNGGGLSTERAVGAGVRRWVLFAVVWETTHALTRTQHEPHDPSTAPTQTRNTRQHAFYGLRTAGWTMAPLSTVAGEQRPCTHRAPTSWCRFSASHHSGTRAPAGRELALHQPLFSFRLLLRASACLSAAQQKLMEGIGTQAYPIRQITAGCRHSACRITGTISLLQHNAGPK